MLEFLGRLFLGGLIVAAVPLVASRVGPSVAGVIILLPVVSLVSFASLGVSVGAAPVGRAALGTLVALPSTLAFMLVTYCSVRVGAGVAVALLSASAGWLIVATPLTLLIAKLGM